MSGHAHLIIAWQCAEIFGSPNIARFHAVLETKFMKTDFNGLGPVEAIKNPNRPRTIRERTRPDSPAAFGAHPIGLLAERILIDRDHLAVSQHGDRLGFHRAQVISCKQRRG